MGRRARRVTAAATVAAAAASVAVVRALPSDAHACVTVTAYQAGQPSTSGPHCRPVLDEWAHTCPTVWQVQQGYGAQLTVCAPDPPVATASTRIPPRPSASRRE